MKCRQVSLGPTVEPQALTEAALESRKSATDVRKCFEREAMLPSGARDRRAHAAGISRLSGA
jgi:hypothetical protein